jgi:hypothetical protein
MAEQAMPHSIPPSAASTEILTTYCHLMEELKARHAIVVQILRDAREQKFAFAPYVLGELCFLQLRMMCELIALGCLMVHGDIPATRTQRMQKATGADWIINSLSKINPKFYPLPSIELVDEAAGVITIDSNLRPHLTKAKLLKLYVECGTILHRGNLKSLKAAWNNQMELVKVGEWAAQITQLLNYHRIPLTGGQHEIWVVMNQKPEGHVFVRAMERIADPGRDAP